MRVFPGQNGLRSSSPSSLARFEAATMRGSSWDTASAGCANASSTPNASRSAAVSGMKRERAVGFIDMAAGAG